MSGPAKDHATWFKQAVKAVVEVVETNNGAVKVSLPDLRILCEQIDPGLTECPVKVWDHILCSIGPNGGLRSELATDGAGIVIRNEAGKDKRPKPLRVPVVAMAS